MTIKAKELKPEDILIFNGYEQVTIDTVFNNCLWTTNKQFYLTESSLNEGDVYTNTGLIPINFNDIVELRRNMNT